MEQPIGLNDIYTNVNILEKIIGHHLLPYMSKTIIWLNGTSSSGKSSVTKEISNLLQEKVLQFDHDEYVYTPADRDGLDPIFLNERQLGFYNKIRKNAKSGYFVIVESIFDNHLRALEVMKMFIEEQVYFIELYCPLDVLQKREKERGDRRVNQAKGQYYNTYMNWKYDLKIDTSIMTPLEVADKIFNYIKSNEPINAFRINIEFVKLML